MTREELLKLVNEKEDTSKFTSLSQRTINDELDDMLDEMGDDAEANDRIVTKLANRLKRMNGNLHKNVSDEIKKSKEESERKRQEEENRKREKEGGGGGNPDDKYDKVLAKLEAMEKANAEREKRAAKNAVLDSVRSGLKDKFSKAKLEMNDFFLDTALSKLDIPDEDADILDLVSKAENIYTADYKRANGGAAIPHKGSENPKPPTTISDNEWDDIKDTRGGDK
jgi:hypothetical protein